MNYVVNNVLIYSFPDSGKTTFIDNMRSNDGVGYFDTDEIKPPSGSFSIYGADFEGFAVDILSAMVKHQIGMCICTNLPRATQLPFAEIFVIVPEFSRLSVNRHNYDYGRDAVISWYRDMLEFFINHHNHKHVFISLANHQFVSDVIRMEDGIVKVTGEIIDIHYLDDLLEKVNISEIYDRISNGN